MKDLTHFLLSYLVDNQEAMAVSEQTNDAGFTTISVTVAKEDMGKVIGKEGRIIRALRDCIKILALKQNKHVDVVLVE